MDKVAPHVRSRIMSAVKNKGNKSTESAVRYRLVRAGISGWRVNARDLPGSPDFAFDNLRLAVYVDGCFWHDCPKHCRRPKSNVDFWESKFRRNRLRDRRTRVALRRMGWSTLRLWEHDLRNPEIALGRITRRIAAIC
jgi:DNA mismatch endonuclease (patch repair protein)